MKIQLTLNGQVMPATLANTRTAREVAAMLPLTLTMHDFFRREKFGPLPRAVSARGTRTQNYEVGDIVCWAPGPDLTIFYRQDGQAISGGLHVIGRLDGGVEAFGGTEPLTVTIEVAEATIEAPTTSTLSPRPSRPSWPSRRSSSTGSCGNRI